MKSWKKLVDNKYIRFHRNYFLQSFFAALVILILSFSLDIVLKTATVASVGATVFIIFTMPKRLRSRAKVIIGGYIIGVSVGSLAYWVTTFGLGSFSHLIIALAVGIAIFLMVITDTEHPPAAGACLGLAVEGVNLYTVMVIFVSLFFILLAKYLLRKWLIDLL